jgi:DNA-binding CsgD family transcriptional regulator/tetratricopeptide (TPR) repeat protein
MARSGSASADRATLRLQWPLIGRREEIELFEHTLTDPRAHGFMVHGAPGVGKTRLGDECLAVAHRRGRTVARATATEGLEAVPLGALAPLIPSGLGSARCDLIAVFDAVAPVLREEAAAGPLVLFVDDLHWLDATSATLVAQLVDADLVFLVGTVRTDAPVSRELTALAQRARVRRIDLHELDKPGVDTLLHLVLGGPVTPTTIDGLWSASRGNLLFVHELVLGALETGALVEEHGVWRLVGKPTTTGRLLELVEERVGVLGPKAREALDVVAVWEPTSVAMLDSALDPDLLEQLDAAGLLATRADGRRDVVTLAHPLYGEVLRTRMAPLTRRRLLLQQADTIEEYGARRRGDPIRIATARVDASGQADPHLLLEAARLARWASDFAQVERLAKASIQGEPTVEAGLLLGEAMYELGSFDDAERELAEAARRVTPDDPLGILISELRTRTLMWGVRRPDEALALSREDRERCADPAGRAELALNEAFILMATGRPLDALELVAKTEPVEGPRARALRDLARVSGLIVTGRPVTAAQMARDALADHQQIPQQMAITNPAVHLNHEIQALTDSGAFADAMTLAETAYDALPSGRRPRQPMWLTYLIGRCAILEGRPATARRWLGETIARSDEFDLGGSRRAALSLLAAAHVWLGATDAAAAALAELERLPVLDHSRAEQVLGAVWVLVAAGDVPRARSVLSTAAESAAESGHRSSEAWLRHEVVRLGGGDEVADRLDELAEQCEGELVAAYAFHGRAVCGSRPEPMVDAADRFETIGARMLAAEASAEAAQAYQRRGDGRSASAMRARVTRLVQECEGARTPALHESDSAVPLSTRERDVALLAARGETAKEIAARLFLSTRTVNNHLQNVYTKLGISGRPELAAALGLTDEDPRPPSSTRP